MKIFMDSPYSESPTLDLKEGSISVPQDQKLYIHLGSKGKSKEINRRHDGELIMQNGWIHLDYDIHGFLVGLEIVEGDPITGVSSCIEYLQPINPLIQ